MLTLPENPRFLIIRCRKIGDVLLDTPLIKAIKRFLPCSKVAFLTDLIPSEVLRLNPYLDKLIVRDGFCSTLREVRRFKPNVVIDLMRNLPSILLSALSGATYRIGIYKPNRQFFYTHTVKVDFQRYRYTVYHRLQPLTLFGFDITSAELTLDFPVPQSELEWASDAVRRFRNGHKFVAAMQVFTEAPMRQWPLPNFLKLAEWLERAWDCAVMVLWIPKIKSSLKKVFGVNRLSPPTTNLHKLAALLRHVDFFVGPDSGPKHIAISQSTPTFALFFSEDPRCWTPPDSPIHRFVAKNLPCQFCWAKKPKQCTVNQNSPPCIYEFKPDDVIPKLDEFIREVVNPLRIKGQGLHSSTSSSHQRDKRIP